eukprot:CAMPEP_0167791640 /NCGR_PEP_ID=MMETSP0111_2-20121227/12059_1 /TAXON_ID=91324 /ORGANISM="Lotharella globosa, Strain CCCM811" /LENGTH=365 /DNA_ID=CAMNT_0007684353 /DNA_START=130 /DNA_END=1227 /DNA_ORIENTATION=+
MMSGKVLMEEARVEEHGQCGKELVIIRTVKPTGAMIDRMGRIISDLPGREVIISANLPSIGTTSAETPQERKARQEKQVAYRERRRALEEEHHDPKPVLLESGSHRGHTHRKSNSPYMQVANDAIDAIKEAQDRLVDAFGERVYLYNDSMLVEALPSLRKVPQHWDVTSHLWSYGYNFHDEAIYVAVKQFETRTGRIFDGCGLWVIEDDLEYSGNWREILDKYSGKGDLVSLVSPECPCQFTDMRWQFFTSKMFQSNFQFQSAGDLGFVMKHSEHIVYYSRNFLRLLHRELENGVHAHSEMGTPTICRVNGCKMESINLEEYDYADGYYTWPGVTRDEHSQKEFQARVEALRANHTSRFVHPCKY